MMKTTNNNDLENAAHITYHMLHVTTVNACVVIHVHGA